MAIRALVEPFETSVSIEVAVAGALRCLVHVVVVRTEVFVEEAGRVLPNSDASCGLVEFCRDARGEREDQLCVLSL